MESSTVTVVERYTKTAHHTDFECRDCGGIFTDSAAFGEHFVRAPDSIAIIGCKYLGPLAQRTKSE